MLLRSAYRGIHENPTQVFGTGVGEGLDPGNDDMFDDVAERNGCVAQISIGSRREACGKHKAPEPTTFTTRKFGEMAASVDVTLMEAADDGNNLVDFLGEKSFIKFLTEFQVFTKQLGAIKELHDHTFLNELHGETVRPLLSLSVSPSHSCPSHDSLPSRSARGLLVRVGRLGARQVGRRQRIPAESPRLRQHGVQPLNEAPPR